MDAAGFLGDALATNKVDFPDLMDAPGNGGLALSVSTSSSTVASVEDDVSSASVEDGIVFATVVDEAKVGTAGLLSFFLIVHPGSPDQWPFLPQFLHAVSRFSCAKRLRLSSKDMFEGRRG